MADNVSMREDLVGIGDEWAPRVHTMRVIDECIFPKVKKLLCFDISQEMMNKAAARLESTRQNRDENFEFHLISGEKVNLNVSANQTLDNSLDFIYS